MKGWISVYWVAALIGLLLVVLTMSTNHVIGFLTFIVSFFLLQLAFDKYIFPEGSRRQLKVNK